ncbi:MAG: response regulator [Chitinophagaceae bacterium]
MTKAIKILIVDDEMDICYFLSHNLSKRKFVTTSAYTLAEAEKELSVEEPYILLLDNHLPDGLGIDFASKIKNKYPHLKIVMITAHDSPQDRSRAYSNGVNYFLSKPFTINEVNRVIDVLIEEEAA